MKLPGLRLRLATSQLIRQWAQRRLPNGKIISGQILNPKTINYQTLKPEKDGLFCERIFGPMNDSICACGRPLRGQKFCPRCEVEYISSRVRRYRLGYIQLITATAHIWFFKGRPSYFSLFLNLSKKKIECLLYCTKNISRTIFPQELSSLNFYSIQKFNNVQQINLRSYVAKNWIFGSFFSERGYWNFKKNISAHSFGAKRRALAVSQKKEAASAPKVPPRGAKGGTLAPKGGTLGAEGLERRRFIAAGSDSPAVCPEPAPKFKGYKNCLIVSSDTFISLMEDGQKTRFKKFWTNRINKKKTKLYFLSSSFIDTLMGRAGGSALLPRRRQRRPWGPNSDLTKQFFYPDPINLIFQKKSRWQEGGLRDSAIYFGFSLVSKMLSWQMTAHWFSFVYFLIQSPLRGDTLNKFYPGPPGLVNFWGFESRLFCSTGVQLMRTWLTQLTQNQCHDGRLLEIQIRLDLIQLECEPLSDNEWFYLKSLLFRRFKYLRSFRHTQMNPASMILSVLPVLPPDLRPILQLDNNQIAVSDFNKLYQTVLLRNKRLSRLTTLDQTSHCLNSEALQYSQRLLQESVDSLIDNGKVSSISDLVEQRPLKSLSDLFKGKKGRFRQNLLGKRVDYSGRSVIVVGPYLKIYECGLPKEIAYELFQPFLLRILMFKNQAQTILGAKKLLQQKPLFIWGLLKEIVHSHPILLNRAPSLHRLSIQAFQPRLINGKAILLHPLVCAAFNADFDGDQMGVHLPLCFEARGEAWKITWSQNNLFSVATGSPTCSPSQDMILGSSFLTMENTQKLCFNLLKAQNFNEFNKKNWIVQKRKKNLIKWLLFEKPHFFKNTSLNLDAEVPPSAPKGGTLGAEGAKGAFEGRASFLSVFFDKKNNLSETTLPNINIISFSQKSHPFIFNLQEGNWSQPQGLPLNLFDKNISMNDPIWCSYNPILNKFETEKKKQKLIEIRINLRGQFQKFRSQFFQQYHSSGVELLRQIRTTYGRIKFYESLALLE